MNSNYVENMRTESVKQFDDEMALREFRQRFKLQIENGLTLKEARRKYQMTAADIENFNIVEDEVKRESALGDAFIKGFQER